MLTIDRALRWLATAALWAGAVAILAMMAHVTADVLLKVTVSAPIMGTLEIVSFIYMVGCTFLPLAHVQLSRAFIVVELFTQNLKPRAVLILETALAPLGIFYLGMLAVMGAIRAWDKTGLGETQDATYFELPVWPMRWVLAISCGLAAIIALYQMLDDLKLLRSGRRYDGSTAMRLGDHTI
jgi:TRAP-type C4-dicarboxylate transport system permease small subunit